MANPLQNLMSGSFFKNLSETLEDVVEVIEDVTEDITSTFEEVVEFADDVIELTEDAVDQNQDAFEELSDIDLSGIIEITLPRFNNPSDLIRLPSAIFDLLGDVSGTDFLNFTLPQLPELDFSGLGLGFDSIDLNLDLDLNEVVVTIQGDLRDALDNSEEVVSDIEELVGDIADAVDEGSDAIEEVVGETGNLVLDAVAGFLEQDPGDTVETVRGVFDGVVDTVGDAVEDVSNISGGSVSDIIGGIFDVIVGVSEGVEEITGTDSTISGIINDVGEFTTELTLSIEEEEIATIEFLDDVIELSEEVGDFLDDFNELADEAIANFEELNVGVNLDIDRDLLISIGEVAVDISAVLEEISDGDLPINNPLKVLVDRDEPAILSASVTASVESTAGSPGRTQVLANATLMLDSSVFGAEASVTSPF